MRKIPVQTASAAYDIMLGRGILASLRPRIDRARGKSAKSYYVITSPEIWALWSAKFLASFQTTNVIVLFIASGEANKRLAAVEHLTTQLSTAGADRGSVILAFGGGVIGDVAGFAAAIYMRGIDYIQIPTTLLAQVDSSVGGKTGVNLKTGKNLIGSFHHPRAVFVDPDMLATLPDNEYRAGLFESIKAGLIRDRSLLNRIERERDAILARDPALLERVIAASIRVKAEVVGEDEHESGLRMVLNFGHTLGHAIEATAGYGKILHGEAVGYGMIAALALSRMRGLPVKEEARAVSLILTYGLPTLPRLSPQQMLKATANDKKSISGSRRFVLLRKPGEVYVTTSVTDKEVVDAISIMLSLGAA